MNRTLLNEIEKKFNNKKFDEVLDKLLPTIKDINNKQTDIPLWNVYYLIGQSYRYKKDFENASSYLKKSVETLENFSNLKALGIVYQQIGEYNEAIKLLSKSLNIDDSQSLTWNSLAYTQKHMKQYDKAEKNYETGINIYLKNIVKSLNNSRNSVFYPFNEAVNHAPLFVKYALDAAIYLTARKNYDSIAFPSGATAEAMVDDKINNSLYWTERIELKEKKKERILVIRPNFIHTIFNKLINDQTYFLLIGNKAEVLELQGKEEAKKYLAEAKLFKSIFENA